MIYCKECKVCEIYSRESIENLVLVVKKRFLDTHITAKAECLKALETCEREMMQDLDYLIDHMKSLKIKKDEQKLT